MKSYEILPAGMTGSVMGRGAKLPKSYEILPGAGTAEQGLGGWTKGATLIAWGVPTYAVSGNQTFGLPYDPRRTAPTYGGATVPHMGKQSKAYEIQPDVHSSSYSGMQNGLAALSENSSENFMAPASTTPSVPNAMPKYG